MKCKNTSQLGAAAIVVAMLAVGGCGGSSSSSSAPTTTTPAATATSTSNTATTAATAKEQAAKTYVAAIGPANNALHTFVAKARGWTSSTPASQAAADARPTIEAAMILQTKLLALAAAYPAAATHLKAQVHAIAAMQGDLAGLATIDMRKVSSWEQRFIKHASATTAASAIVRSDLGLPPPQPA